MDINIINIIARFAREGVLHRDEVKNDTVAIRRLLHHGFIRKVQRNRKVFYELTEKTISILEVRRRMILDEVRLLAALHKPPSIFHSLLGDVRFFDEKHESAKQFKFLGDWQLTKPVVSSQLELAKLRFYKSHS